MNAVMQEFLEYAIRQEQEQAGADAKEAYRKLKEKAGRLSVALLEA
jgi:hypothetical protein